jgi:hypothetical protein
VELVCAAQVPTTASLVKRLPLIDPRLERAGAGKVVGRLEAGDAQLLTWARVLLRSPTTYSLALSRLLRPALSCPVRKVWKCAASDQRGGTQKRASTARALRRII